jgi:hypothetical protein
VTAHTDVQRLCGWTVLRREWFATLSHPEIQVFLALRVRRMGHSCRGRRDDKVRVKTLLAASSAEWRITNDWKLCESTHQNLPGGTKKDATRARLAGAIRSTTEYRQGNLLSLHDVGQINYGNYRAIIAVTFALTSHFQQLQLQCVFVLARTHANTHTHTPLRRHSIFGQTAVLNAHYLLYILQASPPKQHITMLYIFTPLWQISSNE